VQGEEREQKQGEEEENGNGNRNYISGELANSDDTHADLGASMKPPVQSWVQRKRASFELMCASRNEDVYNIKPEKLFMKQIYEQEINKPEPVNEMISNYIPDFAVPVCVSRDDKENEEDGTSNTSLLNQNKTLFLGDSQKKKGNTSKEEATHMDQPCNIISNDTIEKSIAGNVLDTVQLVEEKVSETYYESNQIGNICIEFMSTDAIEMHNDENLSNIIKIEENVSERKNELIDEDQPSSKEIESEIKKLNDPIDDNQTCNDVVGGNVDEYDYNDMLDNSFLSRDEAIKLSTNASGNSQPRLSTIQGSKLLIKHGETDSTCKEDGMDKILDINIEKVNNTMNIIAEELESEDSDQGLLPIKTIKNNESQKLPGKQPVIQRFGSKDPVVKKMVYNQYREMLRKYTQSSRL